MKFSTSSVVSFFYALFAFAMVAAAMPGGHPGTTTPPPVTTTVTVTAPPTTTTISSGDCNTGPIQCCNSVQKASDGAVGVLLGLLGVVLQDLNVLVGITCSPITVIGGGGAGCSASPVCCENNSFHGIIAIGCVPINISL